MRMSRSPTDTQKKVNKVAATNFANLIDLKLAFLEKINVVWKASDEGFPFCYWTRVKHPSLL